MIKRYLSLFLFIFFSISYSEAQLGPEITLGEFSETSHLAVGDIDGDGLKDIVSNELRWYQQLEDGSFGTGKVVGPTVERTSLFDLDQNGTLDILYLTTDGYGSSAKDSVFWLSNTGQGDFLERQFIGDFDFLELAFVDVDTDGDIDIISLSGNIFLIENNGEEDFAEHVELNDAINSPGGVVMEDIDGDNDLDILFTRQKIMYVIRNNGGTFAPATFYWQSPLTGNLGKFQLIDMDDDGQKDLVVRTGSILYWLQRNGSIVNFIDPIIMSREVDSYYVIDLNNDGFEDVLKEEDGDIYMSLNKSDGTFANSVEILAAEYASNHIYEDINNDGLLELLYIKGDKVFRVRDIRKQAFPENTTTITPDNPVVKMDMGDINGDGLLDVLILGSGDQPLEWYSNILGAPIFTEAKSIPSGEDPSLTINISEFTKLVDWDSDGDLDVVGGSYNEIYWFSNLDGNGIFGPGKLLVDTIFNRGYGAFSHLETTQIADFNKDGYFDFVGVGFSPSELIYWQNDGNDNFTKTTLLQVADIDDLYFYVLDVSMDGDMDIVYSNTPGNTTTFSWIENDNGVLQSPADLFTESSITPRNIRVEDLDQDGNFYILHNNFNNGNDIFAYQYDAASNTVDNLGLILDPYYLATFTGTVDIDQDGDLDLVLHDQVAETFNWVNNNNGVFQTTNVLLDSVPPGADFRLEDLTGNGEKEIVCIQGSGDYPFTLDEPNNRGVAWYEKQNNAYQRTSRKYITNDAIVRSYGYMDFDGDGDLDYIGKQQDEIFWRENYDGQGHFSTERTIVDLAHWSGDDNFLFFDHGNDGDLDIVFKSRIYDIENERKVATYALAGSPIEYYYAADLNRDGFNDLITIDYYNEYINYHQYQSTSGDYNLFGERIPIADSINITGANFLDIDNDGDMDILIGDGSGDFRNLHCLLNDGNANFAEPFIIIENVEDAQNIRIADINSDGRDDIVLTQNLGSFAAVNWYPNLAGSALIGDPVLVGTHSEESYDYLFTKDIDNDGDIDIAHKDVWYSNLDGTGTFAQGQPLFSNPSGFIYNASQMEDLNGDGTLELIIYNSYINSNSIVDGKSATNVEAIIDISNYENSVSFYVDVDLDGDEDMVVSVGNKLFWYQNNPGQNASATMEFTDMGCLLSFRDTPILGAYNADINGDQQRDIVVYSKGGVGWINLMGEGIAPNIFLIDYSDYYPFHSEKTLPMDVDDDGDVDIVSLYDRDGYNLVVWYENLNGLGLFNSIEEQIYFPSGGLSVEDILVADKDGDGDEDLLMHTRTNVETTDLYCFENTDGLDFTPTVFYTIAEKRVTSFTFADLDLDNDLDLFIVGGYNQEHTIYYALKNGNSYNTVQLMDDVTWDYHILTDFNNDDLPDLLFKLNGDDKLFWMAQDSDITFGDQTPLPMVSPNNFAGVRSIVSFDFDQDFDNDIFYLLSTEYPGQGLAAWRENLISNPLLIGRCYFDENQNGEMDDEEIGLDNFATTLDPGSITTYSHNAGEFEYRVTAGDYVLSYVPTENWELSSDSESYNITVDAAYQVEERTFGFYPSVDTLALDPHLVSGPTRCNFEVPFWLNVHNSGTRITTGEIFLVTDPGAEFLDATVSPDSIFGDTLRWKFADLYPYNQYELKLNFKMPNEFSTGEFITFETIAAAYDESGDSTYFNQHIYSSEIRCAIDPNDKLINPARSMEADENYTLFDEELEFTVRFQNTGNDTAFTVTITDQLDTNLDWSSLRMIGASHDYRMTLKDDGLLTFTFDNILLPDSTTNEPASHGYFSYAISTNEGLDENTVIENTAYIYFDFNKPIITNTTNNVLVSTFDFDSDDYVFWKDCDDTDEAINPGAEEIPNNGIDENCDESDLAVSTQDLLEKDLIVFPNPTNDAVNILLSSDEMANLELWSLDGKHILNKDFRAETSISLKDFSPGVYLLMVKTKHQLLRKKIIKL